MIEFCLCADVFQDLEISGEEPPAHTLCDMRGQGKKEASNEGSSATVKFCEKKISWNKRKSSCGAGPRGGTQSRKRHHSNISLKKHFPKVKDAWCPKPGRKWHTMKNTRKYSKETTEFQGFFKSLKVLLRDSKAEQGSRLTEVNAWQPRTWPAIGSQEPRNNPGKAGSWSFAAKEWLRVTL